MAAAALADLYTIINDPTLSQRVSGAIIVAAANVVNEDPATPNHTNRQTWAKNALSDPAGMGQKMIRHVIANYHAQNAAADTAGILGMPDTDVQNYVNAAINVFAS